VCGGMREKINRLREGGAYFILRPARGGEEGRGGRK